MGTIYRMILFLIRRETDLNMLKTVLSLLNLLHLYTAKKGYSSVVSHGLRRVFVTSRGTEINTHMDIGDSL